MLERLTKGFRDRFGFNPKIPEFTIAEKNRFFEVSKELYNKSFKIKPLSEGLLLATMRNRLIPTHYFLTLNKELFKNIAVLDEKVSFLFTCNRRLFRNSIYELRGKGPLFLVLNKSKEVLGLTEFKNREFSNLVNIGEYLKEGKLDSVNF